MMNERDYKKVKELCDDKRAARKAGFSLMDIDVFIQKQKLIGKWYSSGDIAEIYMAYMLGAFQTVADRYINVKFFEKEDIMGADFIISLSPVETKYIQMKFAKKNDQTYSKYITVVEIGPDKSFTGKNELKNRPGSSALFDFLVLSGIYTEDEEEVLYSIFDEHPEIDALCKKVWSKITG